VNQRIISETKKYVGVTIFLFLFFEGFATYRRLILAQYQIDYVEFGYSLIEAMVLGKIVLLGDMLHLGERYRDRPLIIPTLYKTLCFSVFVLFFAIVEHFVLGAIHGSSLQQIVRELEGNGEAIILARVLVMFIAFLPLFAIWELGEVTAEGRLFELFFRQRETPRIVAAEVSNKVTSLSR
jgi:hypothetical protein